MFSLLESANYFLSHRLKNFYDWFLFIFETKIGSATLSADKEAVVVKGLEATRKSIDDFLGYFPKDVVEAAKEKVKGENELNFKEFDRSLGEIINQNPQSS